MGVAFLLAFVLVALAELGDKSQLLLIAFASRHRPAAVIAGAAIAIVSLQLIAVGLGRAVGTVLPLQLVAAVGGGLFVVFGVMTWRRADEAAEETDVRSPWRVGPVLTVAAAFFLAEFGDKTQLMTVSIAADPAAALRTLGSLGSAVTAPEPGSLATALGVWLGSSLGMLAADVVAVVVGALLGKRLPARVIGRFSAVVFVVFGITMLASAFLGG